jgi:hypothetical protein
VNWKIPLLIIFVTGILFTTSEGQKVHDYQKYFAVCKSLTSNQSYIAIRKFIYHSKINYFVVDPDSFFTMILNEEELTVTDDS